jgi:hypothetical protein
MPRSVISRTGPSSQKPPVDTARALFSRQLTTTFLAKRPQKNLLQLPQYLIVTAHRVLSIELNAGPREP